MMIRFRNDIIKTGSSWLYVIPFIWLMIVGCVNDCKLCGNGGETKTGRLLLSTPIQGIDYKTQSANEITGQTGKTDENGTFRYRDGDTIEFSIGELPLGTVFAKNVITPLDFYGTSRYETDNNVSNMIRFLLSIDDDDNPENGILINDKTYALLSNAASGNEQFSPRFISEDEQDTSGTAFGVETTLEGFDENLQQAIEDVSKEDEDEDAEIVGFEGSLTVPVYIITESNLTLMKTTPVEVAHKVTGDFPQEILDKLVDLVGIPYYDEEDFLKALKKTIGEQNTRIYNPIIRDQTKADVDLFSYFFDEKAFSTEERRALYAPDAAEAFFRKSLIGKWKLKSIKERHISDVTKTTIDYSYDTSGKLVRESHETDEGYLLNWDVTYMYDENNRPIKKYVNYKADKSIDLVYFQDYDDAGNLYRQRIDWDNNGIIDEVIYFSYTTNGRMSRQEVDLNNDSYIDRSYGYFYDGRGLLNRKTQDLNNDGIADIVNEYIHQGDGSVLKNSMDLDGDNLFEMVTDYVYAQAQILMETWIDANNDGIIDLHKEHQSESYLDNLRVPKKTTIAETGGELSYSYTKNFDTDIIMSKTVTVKTGNTETAIVKHTLFTYGDNGYLKTKDVLSERTSEEDKDEIDISGWRYTYTYDEMGNPIVENYDFNTDDTIDGVHYYTYDLEKGLKTRDDYDEQNDGVIDAVTLLTYDDLGHLIKKEFDQDNDNIIDAVHYYTINGKGELIKDEYDVDNNGTIDSVYHYTYDPVGNRVKSVMDNNNDGIVDSLEYAIFDYKGNPTKIIRKNGFLNETHEYLYDHYGNKIEERIDENGDDIPDRMISYIWAPVFSE